MKRLLICLLSLVSLMASAQPKQWTLRECTEYAVSHNLQIKQQVADLPETFTGAMANVPLMAEMVKSYITKEYTNVSPKVVASLVAVFLYLVKQKDIIPDNVPVLGIADDLAVVAAAMKLNEAELTDYANWRTANNLPETTQA